MYIFETESSSHERTENSFFSLDIQSLREVYFIDMNMVPKELKKQTRPGHHSREVLPF
jgi:hypothetical protein